METGISDIQKISENKIQITFCTYPGCEDFMTIDIDIRTAWEIADFCRNHLQKKRIKR